MKIPSQKIKILTPIALLVLGFLFVNLDKGNDSHSAVWALSSACYDITTDSPYSPERGGRPEETGIQVYLDEDAVESNPTDDNRERPREPIINWTTNYQLPDRISGNSQCRYWIQISRDGAFDSIVYDTGRVISDDETHTVPEDYLEREHDYYLRMALRDEYGWTPWSPGVAFHLPQVPAEEAEGMSVDQPNLSDCGNQTAQVTFDWDFTPNDPDDEQTAFRIQVYEDNEIVYDTGKTLSSNDEHTTSFPENFGYDTDYEWMLKVWDSGGHESDWSQSPFRINQPRILETSVDEPDPEEYCSRDNPPAFYLMWDFYSSNNYSQEYYEIQVSEDGFNSFVEGYEGGIVSCPSGGCGDYEFSVDNLDFGESYDWRIRGWDEKCNETRE